MTKLKRLHRRVSRKVKRSKNRRRAIQRLAKGYLRVSRQRKDFAAKAASALVKSSDLIAYENLKIAHLVKNHHLAKSISDASWGLFLAWVRYYGRLPGARRKPSLLATRRRIALACGFRVKKTLSMRTHVCPSCGLVRDRDYNAALNILDAATQPYRRAGGNGCCFGGTNASGQKPLATQAIARRQVAG